MYSACIVIAYLLPALCISAKQKNMASGRWETHVPVGILKLCEAFQVHPEWWSKPQTQTATTWAPRFVFMKNRKPWFRRWSVTSSTRGAPGCLTRLRWSSRRSWPRAASLHSFSKAVPEAGRHVCLGLRCVTYKFLMIAQYFRVMKAQERFVGWKSEESHEKLMAIHIKSSLLKGNDSEASCSLATSVVFRWNQTPSIPAQW